jgi:hypothetical protein
MRFEAKSDYLGGEVAKKGPKYSHDNLRRK